MHVQFLEQPLPFEQNPPFFSEPFLFRFLNKASSFGFLGDTLLFTLLNSFSFRDIAFESERGAVCGELNPPSG